MLGRPSALVPIVLSLMALALVIAHLALFGVTHEADEGTAAHVYQLIMLAQVPFVVYFAVTWLPRRPRQSLCVLGLQAGAALLALAPILLLEL